MMVRLRHGELLNVETVGHGRFTSQIELVEAVSRWLENQQKGPAEQTKCWAAGRTAFRGPSIGGNSRDKYERSKRWGPWHSLNTWQWLVPDANAWTPEGNIRLGTAIMAYAIKKPGSR